jgi:hypothetical protein
VKGLSVRHPALGLIGLIALGLVGTKLWSGDLTITEAAVRIAVVTGALIVTERFLLPVARSLIGAGSAE